ncbi:MULTISPECIES: Ger(x)C family spore germination protein [Sutcliffiella]|uniref:Ger(X)C family spore germination protein n=1 Tax=Sutcliffiella cohnii TaxID=33932 RepID=A0A223KSQ1_9BACI|nr:MULTISPECIES: Ger(x)C family spore germination protein [Sutcliffiella]AST92476.1 hypothetical protein BC6307_14825 [Sutcliffiella cohnii]MED4017048.1 Ger(x)C family spore germination protein [Sutcliffiella cohnii]WBL13713.1 Ger(x)C family spore germination protein [Sutcliffiella sp. NC1]
MKPKLLIAFLLLPIVVSCQNPNVEYPVIEDLGMVGIMGFDYVDERQVKVTMTLSPTREEEKEKVQQGTSTVEVPHQAVLEMSTISEKILSLAQLRVLLFSEEYAAKVGIWETIEHLYRDPNVGANVFVAVISGSAEEALSLPYEDKPEINVYLNELLTPRIAVAFNPFTTIHDFIYRLTDNISDPTTPYLEVINENSLKITRVALFKGDKFISTISPEEAKLVEALKKRRNIPDMSISLNEGVTTLRFVKTRILIETNGDLQNLTISTNLFVNGSVIDYEGHKKLDTLQNQVELEQKVSEQLNEQLRKVIKHFQELEIDPIGLGEKVKVRNSSNWTKENWNKVLKDAEIKTNVKVTIVSPGTIS